MVRAAAADRGAIRKFPSMAASLVISIDGMGGDSAPDIVVEGVDIAARSRPEVRFQLHGDSARIHALLERFPRAKAASDVYRRRESHRHGGKTQPGAAPGQGIEPLERRGGGRERRGARGRLGRQYRRLHGHRHVPPAHHGGCASPGAGGALARRQRRLRGDARRRRQCAGRRRAIGRIRHHGRGVSARGVGQANARAWRC